MKVQFLGTGGFHPTEQRHTAGLLLPELGIAFDAGTSAFRIPSRLQTNDLSIFISHAHLDHICGLTYLLVPLLERKIESCCVFAIPEVIATIESHLLSPSIFPVKPRLEFVPITTSITLPSGTVTTWPLHHPGGATGFRLNVKDGPSIAYVSDTNAHADSIPFLRSVDLLVHECTYPDRLSRWCEATGHSHTSQVANIAQLANVGQLLLTHIDPQQTGDDPVGIGDARQIFSRTYLAEDGMELEIEPAAPG